MEATGFDDLPEDMLFEILLLLPVQSLLRVKLVCNRWCSLIESLIFASERADRSDADDTGEDKLISMELYTRKRSILVLDLQEFRRFAFDLNNSDRWLEDVYLIGSFHGIVCIQHYLFFTQWDIATEDDEISVEDIAAQSDECRYLDVVSLWNPATKHVKILPPPKSDIRLITYRGKYHIHYGFGFDAKTRDYRVVRVILDFVEDNTLKSHVEVYSRNEDSWRGIRAAGPSNIWIHSHARRPLGKKNEVYYWLGWEYSSKEPLIFSFDFSKEEFGIISLEPVLGVVKAPKFSSNNQTLSIIEQKLAFVHLVPGPSGSGIRDCKIWVFDPYGKTECWSRLYVYTLQPGVRHLGFSMDGKMIYIEHDDGGEADLFLFDPASHEISNTPYEATFNQVAAYKESLVSVGGEKDETYRVDIEWKATSPAWNDRVKEMIRASNKEFAEILEKNTGPLILFDEPTPVPNLNCISCWECPPVGTIKINTDAIWRYTSRLGTFGWVARDEAGGALRAACSSPSSMHSYIIGEAEAIRSALDGAREAGWERIIIECSYKPLVDMIEEQSASDSGVSAVVTEIIDLLTSFKSVEFTVLPMVLNTAAHLLAHHGFTLQETQTWVDHMPDCLTDVLLEDHRRSHLKRFHAYCIY